MRFILVILASIYGLQVQAAIYVCQASGQQRSYQDTPCVSGEIRTLAHVPDASIEDQQRAIQRTQATNIRITKQIAAREEARELEEKQQLQRLALENERKRLALLAAHLEEDRRPAYVYARNLRQPPVRIGLVGAYPWYGYPPYHHHSFFNNQSSGVGFHIEYRR